MWSLKKWRQFKQKVLKHSKLSECKAVQKKREEKLQRNFRGNELCIRSMLSILKHILSLPPTSHQPPTLSPSLYISLPLLPNIPLSTSLAPCPVHILPLAARVTESYPSCHQRGNVREQQGETGGSGGMMLLVVHASALACHDTCKQPRSAPEIHLLYGELSAEPRYQTRGSSR